MATITEPAPPAADTGVGTGLPFLTRIRKLLQSPEPVEQEEDLTFFARVRKFLWLSSGLFSAASFAIPVIGYYFFGADIAASTNFLVAVMSACLFGFASLLHFGPDTA